MRANLRGGEELAMLGGMISMLQALHLVSRAEARKGGMRLYGRNGLTVAVFPSEPYAEVSYWETGASGGGMQVQELRNPDQLSELLGRLFTLKLYDERQGLAKWADFLRAIER